MGLARSQGVAGGRVRTATSERFDPCPVPLSRQSVRPSSLLLSTPGFSARDDSLDPDRRIQKVV
jgi:hypothetical protein